MYSIDALHHFLLIVEHGTFTAAAKQAHLSQPALTASIHKLEADLGASLLVRDRSGARPTAAGDALLPHARAAIAAMEDGRRSVAEVMGLATGEVRLGASATACTYVATPHLAAFRRAHPRLMIRVRESIASDVMAGLERGDLDLGLVTVSAELSRQHPLIESKLWHRDEMVVVAPPGLDPRGAPFVTFLPGATSREMLDRHFPEAEIAMELGSIASVKSNVRAGVGVALVSRAAVAVDVGAGRLVLVRDARTPIARRMHLCRHRKRPLSPAAAALYDLLVARRARRAR